MTSNILADLAPRDALARFQIPFGSINLLPQTGPIEKSDVIGQGTEPLGRQLINGVFDLSA
jgi:hypothetical protein